MAALAAVAEVTTTHRRPPNFVFVIEGEGENGSRGFVEAVTHPAARPWLRDASLLLSSNNTWLDEDRPCLTYGLRGLLQLRVGVSGPVRDLHSGVDGGVVREPLVDLAAVVASLTEAKTGACARHGPDCALAVPPLRAHTRPRPPGRVAVPSFYDNVAPPSSSELALY